LQPAFDPFPSRVVVAPGHTPARSMRRCFLRRRRARRASNLEPDPESSGLGVRGPDRAGNLRRPGFPRNLGPTPRLLLNLHVTLPFLLLPVVLSTMPGRATLLLFPIREGPQEGLPGPRYSRCTWSEAPRAAHGANRRARPGPPPARISRDKKRLVQIRECVTVMRRIGPLHSAGAPGAPT
jgi:hypothetical protein